MLVLDYLVVSYLEIIIVLPHIIYCCCATTFFNWILIPMTIINHAWIDGPVYVVISVLVL